MRQAPRPRQSITPTVVTIVGILIGSIGLLLFFWGTGVISPTGIQVARFDFAVMNAIPGIMLMAIGFGVAASVLLRAMSKGATPMRMTARRRGRIPLEPPVKPQTRQTWDLLDERPPYFS